MYMYTFTKKVHWCRAVIGIELHPRPLPLQFDAGLNIRWNVASLPVICTKTGVRRGGSINPSILVLTIVQDTGRIETSWAYPAECGVFPIPARCLKVSGRVWSFFRSLPERPEKLRLRNWLSLFIGGCAIEGPKISIQTKKKKLITTQSQIRNHQ